MSRKRLDHMHCGVAQALEQVGDWWTLLIVRDAFWGHRRFSQFEKSLGISKNILSDRMHKLLANGVMSRHRLAEPGVRYEYRLTEKGRDLWAVLTALQLWSARWVFAEDDVPLVAVDKVTGRKVKALVSVDDLGQPVDLTRLRWVRGPHSRRGPSTPTINNGSKT